MKPSIHSNPKYPNSLILMLLGAGLLRLSWQKWVNISIDYGREVYLPWRITCGQVLYKDLASLFGPLPPYWNALLFKVFGVSLMPLIYFNILLVAGLTFLIYEFISSTLDDRAALFASAVFLVLLAFRQGGVFWDQGNYAYICPYTYSVTYALFLAFLSLYLFLVYCRTPRYFLLGTMGFFVGLTALCRFEISIYILIALIFGLIVKGCIDSNSVLKSFKAGVLFFGSVILPIAVSCGYFSTKLPSSMVITSVLGINGKWQEILNNSYYQFMTGLDKPWQNFNIMVMTALCYLAVILTLKVICMLQDYFQRRNQGLWGAAFVLSGTVGLIWFCLRMVLIHFEGIFKGLPVLLILMNGYLSWLLWQKRRDQQAIASLLPLWVMTLWGLGMLSKVFLRTQISSEGFVYAMPAIILFVGFYLGLIPSYFKRVHPSANFLPSILALLLVFILIVGLRSNVFIYQLRHFHIQAKKDLIVCNKISYPDLKEIAAFLQNANKIMGPNANFVAFPDGVMLNFLTRRIDPLPYMIFKVSENISFGEDHMLRSFQEHRPDYVVLSNRDWVPDTHDPQGKYPFKIRTWILAHYYPVWPIYPKKGDMLVVLKRSP